jgi:hypothetical protein
LNRTEIEEIVTTLRDQLAEDIAPAESIDVEEAGKAIARAVEAINVINPKNPQSATLATAPAGWKFVVEEGAAALLYRERAAMLVESDPLRSKQYAVFARLHQKEFDMQAALLMQVRPASAGSRIKRE